MKILICFIAFLFHDVCGQKYYPTHFDAGLGWGKHVAYGTDGVDKELFQQFVVQQLNKFNRIFGNFHNFTYIGNFDDLYKFDRFVEFRQSNQFECGAIHAFDIKGSYVYLSVNPENCGEDESMGLILQVLGFTNLVRRIDRDRFVTLLWDNITPVHKSQLYKDYELFKSTDPVFDTIDLESILLISSYSPDAVDPSKPIMEPVEKNESNIKKLNLYDSQKKVTETDIKQYQSIYK